MTDKEVLGFALHPHPGAVTNMHAMASAGKICPRKNPAQRVA
jgi:hypothetical protein